MTPVGTDVGSNKYEQLGLGHFKAVDMVTPSRAKAVYLSPF
jgi:hypothetical protein